MVARMSSYVINHASADAARVLHEAVRSAQDDMLRRGWEQASVNRTLDDLLDVLAPVYDQLQTMAATEPSGAVAAVLAHLHRAYDLAVAGLPESAVASMITAAVTAIRLVDDDVLAAECADVGVWR
jgi:predicted HAD superfamily Cof-like phosphohydrolase